MADPLSKVNVESYVHGLDHADNFSTFVELDLSISRVDGGNEAV